MKCFIGFNGLNASKRTCSLQRHVTTPINRVRGLKCWRFTDFSQLTFFVATKTLRMRHSDVIIASEGQKHTGQWNRHIRLTVVAIALISKVDTMFCLYLFFLTGQGHARYTFFWTQFPTLIWLARRTNYMVSNLKYHAPSSNGRDSKQEYTIFCSSRRRSRENISAMEQSCENLK